MNRQKRLFEVVRTSLAILISLLIAAVIILLVSEEPGESLSKFLLGPLGSVRHFGNVVEMMIPLMFTGLAICVMFSAAQFNLAAEGAFFIGAIAASFLAINLSLPLVIHPALAILFGGLVGAIFCGIPAVLKVKWGSSEIVSSLMINYIALFLGLYLINYFLRDVNAGAMVSYRFPESAKLIDIVPKTRISFGLIIAIAAVFLTSAFLFRTKWGYRIRVLGMNLEFARYSGISTDSVIVYAQAIGGFLAGAGGAIEVLGLYRRFSWQLLPGYGWDGIIVAILARNNPKYVPIGAFFLAYLRIGSDIMSRSTDMPNEFVAIIQGIMIVLIAADSFLARYRHRLVYREAKKAEA